MDRKGLETDGGEGSGRPDNGQRQFCKDDANGTLTGPDRLGNSSIFNNHRLPPRLINYLHMH